MFILPGTKFQLDPTKDKEFPHRPLIIKFAHFCNVMSIDMMLQNLAIVIMGVYVEISHFLSYPTEFFFAGYIKNFETRYEHFESFCSKKQVIKNLSPKPFDKLI